MRVRLLAIALILVHMRAFVFFSFGPEWLYPPDVSVRELEAHSSAYVGQGMNVVGYLVKHTGPHFARKKERKKGKK